jgi:hypothetical protein
MEICKKFTDKYPVPLMSTNMGHWRNYIKFTDIKVKFVPIKARKYRAFFAIVHFLDALNATFPADPR